MNTTVKVLNDALVQCCEQLAWARGEFMRPDGPALSAHQLEDIDMTLRQGAEALALVPASDAQGVIWRDVPVVVAGEMCTDGQCRMDL